MVDRYNPDVLSCLANLSNDEVFTPPTVANAMLDLLPQELFTSPDATFLDPSVKSGVILREIAKRLIKGLAPVIPDLQKRVDHILHKQIFGIATTELTSLMARRTLYCSKYPNCVYSASRFDTVEGNIRFRALKHTFVNGRCRWCGAGEALFDRADGLESHVYEFIHIVQPEELFNMKFDVVVSNPPYQMADGGAQASAVPIYQKFVEQAKKMNPRFLVMIIPARWYAGGKGLDGFREEMLNDKRIRHVVDYFDAEECFPGIDISGGICYFLWNRDNEGECIVDSRRHEIRSSMIRPLLENQCEAFIRFNEAVPIIRKVRGKCASAFSDLVSSRKPFGFDTGKRGKKTPFPNSVTLYVNKNTTDGIEYISEGEVRTNIDLLNRYKIYISYAYGERGAFPYQVIGKPFCGEKRSCCTETYLAIGPFRTKQEVENAISYMRTRFFRFLVLMSKSTQHATRSVYQFVPMQDFSKPWTDEELYAKYGLDKEEIAFIESMIKPMT